MANTALKTQKNDASVEDFLNQVEDEVKRADSFRVLEMMREITGEPATMWGDSIVGFGRYHYTYASGREGDWFVTGFSPRKQALTLYLSYEYAETDHPLLDRLGKYKTGKACLYIKKLADVDLDVLKQLIQQTVAQAAQDGSA